MVQSAKRAFKENAHSEPPKAELLPFSLPDGVTREALLNTILQGTKNPVPDANGVVVDDTVTLRDIYQLLAAGKYTREICRENPDIRWETIALAKAYLIAYAPEIYNQFFAARKPERDIRVLVDENLPTNLLPFVQAKLGHATHVQFVGMKGAKDPELWRYAVQEGFDVILTQDAKALSEHDLTWQANRSFGNVIRECLPDNDPAKKNIESLLEASHDESRKMLAKDIADGKIDLDFNDLPLVVHVKTHTRKKKALSTYVPKVLSRSIDAIYSYLDVRTTPYISVEERRVVSGPNYEKILYTLMPKDDIRARMSERERFIFDTMNTLTNNRSLSAERIEQIKDQVKAAAVRMFDEPTLCRNVTKRPGAPDMFVVPAAVVLP